MAYNPYMGGYIRRRSPLPLRRHDRTIAGCNAVIFGARRDSRAPDKLLGLPGLQMWSLMPVSLCRTPVRCVLSPPRTVVSGHRPHTRRSHPQQCRQLCLLRRRSVCRRRWSRPARGYVIIRDGTAILFQYCVFVIPLTCHIGTLFLCHKAKVEETHREYRSKIRGI